MNTESNETASDASTLLASAVHDVSRESIVNEVLLRYPVTVAVFNAFGIDACCGGAASIADAAQRDGADVERLMAALGAAVANSDDATSGAR